MTTTPLPPPYGVSPRDVDLPVLTDPGMSTLTTPALLPAIPFMAPLVNPAPIGLYPLVNWQNQDGPSRFLGEGVYIRHRNYGGAAAFGVWDAPWCGNVERITISGTGGTWTYTYDGVTASGIAVNVDVPTLQAAVDGLSSVGEGEAHVSSPSVGVYLISHMTTADSSVDGSGLTGPLAGAKTDPVRKEGDRAPDSDPFESITVWGVDECDPSSYSQTEVKSYAEQNLRLLEQVAVERDFAIRLLADAGTPETRGTFASAIAYLEGQLAITGTMGTIHASAEWAAIGASSQVLEKSANGVFNTSPLGHDIAFGGGYVDGLGTTLVATSAPIFGWRDEVQVRTAIWPYNNQFVAIAERSVAIAYEEIIGAVTVTAAP